MTRITEAFVVCRVCGTRSSQRALKSLFLSGIDLDGCPGGLAAPLLGAEIQCCPGCSYCAPDLGAPTGLRLESQALSALVAGPEYRALVADPSVPEQARWYLAWAYLAERGGNLEVASSSLLRAAWSCPPEATDLRTSLRRRALEGYLQLPVPPARERLRICDLFRQVGQFEQSVQWCEKALLELGAPVTPEEYRAVKLYRFCRDLALAGDPQPHQVHEAPSLPPQPSGQSRPRRPGLGPRKT